jgi:serine/threonine protein kinase
LTDHNKYHGESRESNDVRRELPPGAILINTETGHRFQIRRTLGSGGYGITYEGNSLDSGARIAVKEFFPTGLMARSSGCQVSVTGDAATVRSRLNSFLKEAHVLRSLKNNPSAVNIYEAFYANGTAYYVMEYIDGLTVQELIERNGLLKLDGTASMFQQLMRNIGLLHEQGVIHRDISPDNIMITREGMFKLIDFGSARPFETDQSMTVSVKRNFAPLEQYSSGGQGPYTDVYSLAATMFYCFTGKLIPIAYHRRDKESEIWKAASEAGLKKTQVEALCKALEVKPANRFQNMRDFEKAFFGMPFAEPVREPVSTGTMLNHQLTANRDENGRKHGGRIRSAWETILTRPAYLVLYGSFVAAATAIWILL